MFIGKVLWWVGSNARNLTAENYHKVNLQQLSINYIDNIFLFIFFYTRNKLDRTMNEYFNRWIFQEIGFSS